MKRREKITKNHQIEKKRDIVDDFKMNFYGGASQNAKVIKNERLDDIADVEVRRQKMLQMFGGHEAVYKDMMKNINTSSKKFIDAIRFKVTQELRAFKRENEKTVKQLACSSRKKKPEDLSLAGVSRIFKESSQNERILTDMIKEATTFDNRLKKVGLAIDIKKLINDEEDPRKREIGGEESDESESDPINQRVAKEYPDVEDSDEDIDYSQLGKVDMNYQHVMQYFPKNAKGTTFSSRTYNPLAAKH